MGFWGFGVQIRMQQRLSATNGDNGCAQFRQLVHAIKHSFGRDRLREIVVFIAVLASQIAAAYGNDVRQQRMIGGYECTGNHARPAKITVQRQHPAAKTCTAGRHQFRYYSIRPYATAEFALSPLIGQFRALNGRSRNSQADFTLRSLTLASRP